MLARVLAIAQIYDLLMARKPVPHATRRLFESTVASLASLLPRGWSVEVARRFETGGVLGLCGPDDAVGELAVQVRDGLSPRDAVALREPDEPTIVAANWLSPRTRELLDDLGFGYADQTGNVRVVLSRPALVLRTEGASRDPSPKPTKAPNIRGPRAWALLRILAEVQPPYGVSDLAAALDTDPGYVSRLLGALSDEMLISRASRGPVEHVEWESVLRQLASSYSLLDSNETTSWLASAGPGRFLSDLAESKLKDWAITGSFAAAPLVSVTAAEIAVVYADDPERVATLTRLRQVRSGGNVVIARPYDRVVFEHTWSRGRAVYTSPAQTAVDCLTGPGRMPAEGEALLDWLRRKAPRWQASSLTRPADLP